MLKWFASINVGLPNGERGVSKIKNCRVIPVKGKQSLADHDAEKDLFGWYLKKNWVCSRCAEERLSCAQKWTFAPEKKHYKRLEASVNKNGMKLDLDVKRKWKLERNNSRSKHDAANNLFHEEFKPLINTFTDCFKLTSPQASPSLPVVESSYLVYW